MTVEQLTVEEIVSGGWDLSGEKTITEQGRPDWLVNFWMAGPADETAEERVERDQRSVLMDMERSFP